MTAVRIPAIGCLPEAIAMPKLNGSATKATLKAAIKSLRQFCKACTKPLVPFGHA